MRQEDAMARDHLAWPSPMALSSETLKTVAARS